METIIIILSIVIALFMIAAIFRSLREYKLGKIIAKRESKIYSEEYYFTIELGGITPIEVRVSKLVYTHFQIGDGFSILK